MKMILIFCLLVLASPSYSQLFMEENDLHLEDFVNGNGMTEENFNDIIDTAQEEFESISEKTGMELDITGDWNNPTVNAYASQGKYTRYVKIYGGLARRPEITEDGLTLIICHELGHHFGGFPYYTGQWAASEGQSDFYSTMACARRIWSQYWNKKKPPNVLPEVKQMCNEVWYSYNSRILCHRILMAAKSVGDLLGSLHGTTVDFSQKDDKIVDKTYEKHPKPQCRLDTYVAGALCKKRWSDRLIPKTEIEADKSSCQGNKYLFGKKPRCWYAPSE